MSSVTLKQKILLLTIAPILITVLLVMWFVQARLTILGEQEVENIRTSMYTLKKETLQSNIEVAKSSALPLIKQATGSDDIAIKKAVADQLRSITFGDSGDGYVFAFEYSGINVVLRPKQANEGKNLMNLADPNGKQFIKELMEKARNGGGFVSYMWNKPSKNAEVTKLSYAVSIPELNWMIGTGFYIDDIDDAVAETQQKVREEIANSMMVIAGLGIGLAGLSILFSLFIANKVTRPLRQTALALLDISKGDGDLTRRLEVQSNDEVGQVSQGFNEFADKIQVLVTDLKGGIQDLCESISKMNRVVDETHNNVEQQRHETAQAAAAVHEMAAAAQQVAGNASNAATAAQNADSEANIGKNTVEGTISAISSLSGEIDQASEVIDVLRSDAEEIGNVVNVITSIADQTNLLALNAAIEAARAGEFGRGFSVVADEVRTLANRTQQSTDEIRGMIESLQTGAQKAVKVMDTSKSQSTDTVNRAAQASESLNTITHSVGTITEMNTQIASAAEEQTSVAEEISRNVQQVSDIAEFSASSAEELSKTSTELSQLEQRLSSIVGQFKV